MGCDPAARQYCCSKTASDRMLRGRSPWGLGGAVYLLVRSFVRPRLFVDVRSSMLSIGGRGTLDSISYPRGLHRVE